MLANPSIAMPSPENTLPAAKSDNEEDHDDHNDNKADDDDEEEAVIKPEIQSNKNPRNFFLYKSGVVIELAVVVLLTVVVASTLRTPPQPTPVAVTVPPPTPVEMICLNFPSDTTGIYKIATNTIPTCLGLLTQLRSIRLISKGLVQFLLSWGS